MAPLQPNRRRLVARLAIALAAAAVLAVILLKLTPGVYRRTEAIGPDPAAVARFNEQVVNPALNVLLDRSGGTRLDLAITEEMVNARAARFLADEARSGRAVPPVLADARVGFEGGRVVMATRLGSGASGVVVAQHFRLSADAEGRLCVASAGMSAGLLPVPGFLTDGPMCQAVAAHLARVEAAGSDNGDVQFWRYFAEALGGRPVWLGEGRKRILLDRIEIEDGVLKVQGHRAGAETPRQNDQ